MAIDNYAKEQYLDFIKNSENMEPEEIIKIQIQNVLRELAKLLGIIEGGQRLFNPGSPESKILNLPEMKEMQESGSGFSGSLIKIAKKLKIRLQ